MIEYTPTQLSTGGALHPGQDDRKGSTTALSDPDGVAIKTPPTLTSLSPATRPDRGGTTVTVHGTGFTSGSKVSFGSVAATTVKVVSPSTLTAVAPAGLKTVTVTVSTFAGTSATSAASQYTYVGTGYDLVGSDGGVFVFPTGMTHGYYGSLPGIHVVPNKPVVGMVATVTDTGYFLVGADGGVFAFTAPFLGSLPGLKVTPAAPIVGIVAVATDRGYFLVGQDGGVFTFGPAGTVTFLGSLPGRGIHVNNIIGMAATPSGNGYWLVSATGTVYAFGAALQQEPGHSQGHPVAGLGHRGHGHRGRLLDHHPERGGLRLRERQEALPGHTAGHFRHPRPPGDRHRAHGQHNRLLAAGLRRGHLHLRPTGSHTLRPARSRAWGSTSPTSWPRCPTEPP